MMKGFPDEGGGAFKVAFVIAVLSQLAFLALVGWGIIELVTWLTSK